MAKSIEEKMEDKNPTFVNIVKEMTGREEIEKNMIVFLRQKEELVIKKERDEMLNQLKKKKAELSKPYNETMNALKKMINCIYKFGHKFEDEMKTEFEKNLILYNKQLAYTKSKKESDESLEAVNEAIKEINQDYNGSINELTMKCEYLAYVLKVKYDMGEIEEIEI